MLIPRKILDVGGGVKIAPGIVTTQMFFQLNHGQQYHAKGADNG